MSYQITTTLLGLILGGAILYMVRRDHLHGPYAVWWLAVALITIILGVFPTAIDFVATKVGIAYPPTLLFSLVIGLMLIKMLKADIESSRHERRIRRLGQKLAILAEENARLQSDLDQALPDQPDKDPGQREIRSSG
ncbi:MAG: DUF2304 domain-containing protein [Xanthomonadales bacterium]|nr:DUF2304 domain-containing protein [Xanthomonadales bacterium]